MKQVVWVFVFLGVLYAAGVAVGKASFFRKSEPSCEPNDFVDLGFRPTLYPLEQRPFVCVVVGYNNGAFAERTLRSIFSQVYENFRLVYIDDASTDGSFSLVKDIVEESGQQQRVALMQNEESRGELACLSEAIRASGDREIVVWIGGNDWLAHEWALARLNSYYADPDLWLTYGQYREFPDYRLGISAPFERELLKTQGFRGHPFITSHLKTFYAGLFKRVDPADFTYQGTFLAAGIDCAVMIPLLELAKEHFQFVPEILYIANKQAEMREDAEMVSRTHRYIRSLASYAPLPSFLQSEAFCE